MLINNYNYKADDYTQDIVEDIAELCNHILDGDYGKLVEVKEVDLDKPLTDFMSRYAYENGGEYPSAIDIAKHFFELGLKAQKGE